MAGMVNNYVNPYLNPYAQYPNYQAQMTPQLQPQQVTKVNGENGARAYQMAPNSSALLLDECGTIVWLKVTDGAGFPTVTPYDVTPHKTVTSPDFSTLESRVCRLEEMINATSSDTTAVKRKSVKSSNASDDAATQNG